MKIDVNNISPKLIGSKVMLGPLRHDLNDLYRRWLHDLKNGVHLMPSLFLSYHQEEKWINNINNIDNIAFTIYDKANGRPIGTSSLLSIDQVNRNAEFGILIGESDYQNKGFGSESVLLTIDYGFNVVNLESIFLRVHSFNQRALHVYEKLGFKIIGTRRSSYFFSGKYHNDIYMDIIRNDFSSNSTINKLLDK